MGAKTPHVAASSGPKISRAVASSRKAPINDDVTPIIAHQPAEPSPRAMASMAAVAVAALA